MEGKRIKVFGVIMSLLLVFSFAATFSISSTSVVSAGTQKWTQITIPGTDDMQLAPGTNVGAIAVSPDGGTLFAALIVADSSALPANYATLGWYVVKSVDGGYTWKATGLTAGYLAGLATPDATAIVSIKVSPDWVDDGIIVVATQQDAYYSENRGSTFTSMQAAAAGVGTISSLDIGLNDDGDATYVLGTNTDVYILQGFGGWVEQFVDFGYTAFNGVHAVAFSPNYGEDGAVFAVIEGRPSVLDQANGAHLRAETDISVNNWGSYIQDAHFMDHTGVRINPDSACITFAEDYNSAPAVFVGLVSYDLTDTVDTARGDAFRVDLVMGSMGTSAVDDLNIRGENTRTNVNSIAVSGQSTSAFILVGLRDLGNAAQMTMWKGDVHYSSNGGESWLQSYKPPSGMTGSSKCAPYVVMAPDFSESKIAYCGNGYIPGDPALFTGFYVTNPESGGTTWDGRGLLAHSIDEIMDIVPSPDYDNDSTLFMVTRNNNFPIPTYYFGLLWETKDGGFHWELILGMSLMIPLPGVSIDRIEIPSLYPTEPSMFVTGGVDIDPVSMVQSPTALIVRSVDKGNLWAATLKAPYLSGVPQVVQSWKVIDSDTLIVSSANKIWKTTDFGAHWTEEDGNNIADNVIDMQIWNDTTIIVGTDGGDVYICQNWETDFSFTQVDTGPGIAGDEVRVAFDTNYDDTGMIYAGVNGSEQGVWRIDANGGDDWENMWDDDDILSIACDGNGILWALAGDGDPVRQVNPIAPIDDFDPATGESPFEDIVTGLTSDLWTDLETAPTQTYVFAIGGAGNTELWAYIDTLIKPTLISPADGATAAGTILQGNAMALVNLRWEEMPKATKYEYQVAYDTGFGSIAVENDDVEATQATETLYLGEQYYWRVRAVEPIVSQWSDVWTFTTPLGPASSKPVVTYPGSQDSHNDIPLTPTLTWTSTVECTGYELMVAKNCDWSSPIVNLTGSSALGTDTCYSITQALDQGTNYCWKVRAVNEDTGTASPWSDTGTFTTLTVVVEEEEGTPVWVWVVIALSAVLLVGVVVLIIRTRRPV